MMNVNDAIKVADDNATAAQVLASEVRRLRAENEWLRATTAPSACVVLQNGSDGLWAHFGLPSGAKKYSVNLSNNPLSRPFSEEYVRSLHCWAGVTPNDGDEAQAPVPR